MKYIKKHKIQKSTKNTLEKVEQYRPFCKEDKK